MRGGVSVVGAQVQDGSAGVSSPGAEKGGNGQRIYI